MIIDISTKIGTTSNQGSFKGLLDVYSGAAAAYSLRKLSKATTSVVRVRRDSDNAEADFTALEITDGTLEAFCTGTDGLVTTWYDQSGNGNDATQGSASAQPKIVSAGVYLGYVECRDGVADMGLTSTYIYNSTIPFTSFMLVENYGNAVFGATNSGGVFYTVAENGSSSAAHQTFSAISYQANNVALGLTRDDIHDATTSFAILTTLATINSNRFLRIGFTLTSYNKSRFKEVIVYNSQSTDENGIQANINKGFNIYWDGTQKGLLDTYTGAEAAYSLRALNSAYTGAILRVRRASDNAEQDIYAKWDGTLNVDALETFCAATDGYVVTWYDQSGNANNATQATAASQPQIVSSGSIITNSGYQVIQYDGTDDTLSTSFTATGTMLMGGADGGAFYEVAISGAYNLLANASFTDHPLKESIRVIWGRTLSAGEQSAIESRVTYSDWDFSDVTSFYRYWNRRSELTSFPLLDVSSGFNFRDAWYDCNSLTSFPLLDVSSGTNFQATWSLCTSLQDFPANMFDTCLATNFTNAFASTNLTQTSIDNILVSIDTAGQSGGTFNQSGGSAPSATGEAAIDNLRARGWTVSVTGGY